MNCSTYGDIAGPEPGLFNRVDVPEGVVVGASNTVTDVQAGLPFKVLSMMCF
jgi:hypothetical protein